MPLNCGQVFQLVCLVLGTISGLFQVQYGVSLYEDFVKPSIRFSSVVAAPKLAKSKQFFAGDRALETPMVALNISNTPSDIGSNGTMTTNETAVSLLELVLEGPESALVDQPINTTTNENAFCRFELPEPLVNTPDVESPLSLFIDIIMEILTFLMYYMLNAELQLFGFWQEKLALFAPIWVWERELKARTTRFLDLLLALAPVLSWSRHAAIVKELEQGLTTDHEETVLRIHAGYQLVTEAKDAEISDLQKQLQGKAMQVADHDDTIQCIHAGYQLGNEAKDAEIDDLRQQLNQKALQVFEHVEAVRRIHEGYQLVTEAKDTEIKDLRQQLHGQATQVEENDGLLNQHLKTIEEHLKTIETYKEKLAGMLTETSDKSKRMLEMEESHRRSQTQLQTQLKTYDQQLAKDGYKMTPIGLRPLAPPAGPPSSRIPTPQFPSNGPAFNPGAAQFVPRPATLTPQPPHYQPGFRGPLDPKFMGH